MRKWGHALTVACQSYSSRTLKASATTFHPVMRRARFVHIVVRIRTFPCPLPANRGHSHLRFMLWDFSGVVRSPKHKILDHTCCLVSGSTICRQVVRQLQLERRLVRRRAKCVSHASYYNHPAKPCGHVRVPKRITKLHVRKHLKFA